MHWSRVIVDTAFALSWPVFMSWWRRREVRVGTKKPTYEELMRDRDTQFFGFGSLLFWTLMAAPHLDWNFAGEYTGGIVAVFFAAVFLLARWVFRWLDRPKVPPAVK